MEIDWNKIKNDYQNAFPEILFGLIIIGIVEIVAYFNPLELEYTFGYYMFLLVVVACLSIIVSILVWFKERYFIENQSFSKQNRQSEDKA